MGSEAVNARKTFIDEFGCNIHTRRSQGQSKKVRKLCWKDGLIFVSLNKFVSLRVSVAIVKYQRSKDVIKLSAKALIGTLDLPIMELRKEGKKKTRLGIFCDFYQETVLGSDVDIANADTVCIFLTTLNPMQISRTNL